MTLQEDSRPDWSKKPKLRSPILWYLDDRTGLSFSVNPYLRRPQITRLVTPFDVRLFKACDGTRTPEAIADALDVSIDRVMQCLTSWWEQAPDMFKWITSSEEEQKLARLKKAARRMHMQWKAAHERATDNLHYHRQEIHDAIDQFERVESTVSHVFSHGHEALKGRAYGEAFCDKLVSLDLLRPGASVIEMGCGVGRFANSLLNRLARQHPEIYESIKYTLFDLSPSLQKSQKEVCREHRGRTAFMLGNMETHDFQGQRFDLIISNEVIADLSIDISRVSNIERRTPVTDAEHLVLKYQLECKPRYEGRDPTVAVNTGAIHLLEHLPEWLSPGGATVLTEYGSVEASPSVVELEGHNEYSIHFGHLRKAAEQLSLRPELKNLGHFLKFDGNCEVIQFQLLRLLNRYLLPFLGKPHLDTILYSRQMLREHLGDIWDNIGNLQFQKLEERQPLSPFGFYALVLHAPR